MAVKAYDSKLKEKIIRLHLEQGRTVNSLAKEYSIGKSTIGQWITKYRRENRMTTSGEQHLRLQEEIKVLRKQIEEQEKENFFLRKAVAFFAKENE